MEKFWKKEGEKHLLCKTPVFSLYSQKYECLRTGAKHDFITIHTCDWVNVVAETPDKKLVFIRQFRHGTAKTEWEIPGGCVDPGDRSREDAAVRELLEETGYAGSDPEIIGTVAPNPAVQGNACATVLIRNARRVAPPALEPTECIETVELTSESVRSLIASGELRHALVIDAFFFYLLKGNLP